MSVDCGVNLEVIWFDEDLVEVFFTCSNGYFAGGAEIYLNHDDLPKLVEALRGFPSSGADTRLFELGTFDPAHAGGGVSVLVQRENEVQVSR